MEKTLLLYIQKSQLYYQDDTALTQDKACFHKAPLCQYMYCLIALFINQLSN